MSSASNDRAVAVSRHGSGRTKSWALVACIVGSGLGGCVNNEMTAMVQPPPVDPHERDCLMRAMYFESNRSSYDGMMAVGTVVMNRKDSGKYPDTVCGVVGQRNQFAPGALSRKISPRESAFAEQAADAIMAGKRHPNMDYVMYFHTAGLHFPYGNMHYRLVAGGNAFYERYPRIAKRQDTMIAAADATQLQPAQIAAAAPPTPQAVQSQVAQVTVAATSSPIVSPPATQSTLAYAAAPASQPDTASPLSNLLTRAPDQTGTGSATAAPTTVVATATGQSTASPEPTAADTSAPVPR